MKRKEIGMILFAVFLIIVCLAVYLSPQPVKPTPTPVITEPPSATPAPTFTSTATPVITLPPTATATRAEPTQKPKPTHTSTPVPTVTPEPTATKSYRWWSCTFQEMRAYPRVRWSACK